MMSGTNGPKIFVRKEMTKNTRKMKPIARFLLRCTPLPCRVLTRCSDLADDVEAPSLMTRELRSDQRQQLNGTISRMGSTAR